MTLAYFVLWLMLNGRVTAEVIFVGIVVSVSLDSFVRRVLGIRINLSFPLFLRLLPDALLYAVILVWEIIKANLALIRLILAPRIEVEPCLVRMRTRLRSDAARVALANSITLTPGTLTVGMTGDCFLIHAIDREIAKGLSGSLLERLLLRMERRAGWRKNHG